jgi:hypothetical protein
VGLALCLEHPDGIRRVLVQFFHHDVGEVSIDAARVIENLARVTRLELSSTSRIWTAILNCRNQTISLI